MVLKRSFHLYAKENSKVRAIWKLCKFHLKMPFCVVFFSHFILLDLPSEMPAVEFFVTTSTHMALRVWNEVMAIFDNFVPSPIEISINMWACHIMLYFPFNFLLIPFQWFHCISTCCRLAASQFSNVISIFPVNQTWYQFQLF